MGSNPSAFAGDNRPALMLYERLGMVPRFRFATYERPPDD